MSSHKIALTLSLTLLAAPAAAQLPPEDPDPAPAAQPAPKLADVEVFSGALTHRIDIEVPSYHGIEPKLALNYSSSRGDGLMGVGWAIDGFSIIEQATPGHGVARFAENDDPLENVHYLDGVELHRCATGLLGDGSFVACTTGGTHAPRIESYQRVSHDPGFGAGDTWTVTAKDGTVTTYRPTFVVAGGVVRWGVDTVSDPNGNTVTYAWDCIAEQECYPWYVDFGAYLVHFSYEPRPDVLQFASGGPAPAVTAYRLRNVAVWAGSELVRGYRVQYQTSAISERSIATSVEIVGGDASFVDGDLVGGTTLPPQTFTLPSENTAGNAAFAAPEPWADYQGYFNSNAHWTGDFDGDHRSDVLFLSGTWDWWVMLSTGQELSLPESWAPFTGIASWQGVLVADLDHDGRDDVLYRDLAGYWALLSSGKGPTEDTTCQTPAQCGGFAPAVKWADPSADPIRGEWLRDMTGDGLVDLVFHTYQGFFVAKNLGAAFAAPESWLSADVVPNFSSLKGTWLADFNGDGKTDLMYSPPEAWVFESPPFRVHLSSGTTFGPAEPWATYYPVAHHADYRVADFTGDGSADLLIVDGAWNLFVFASTGNQFDEPRYWGAIPPLAHHSFSLWTQDVTGDGKADVVYEAGGAYWVMRARSSFVTPLSQPGFAPAEAWAPRQPWHPHLGAVWLQDFTGDGRADLMEVGSSGWDQPAEYWLAAGGATGAADLYVETGNGLGAATTLAWATSTVWPNDGAMPLLYTIAQATVSDGRGGSASRGFAYAGGRWDRLERKFLGFREVVVTEPCLEGETSCPTTRTRFRQDPGSIGKPERVEERDGEGTLLRETEHVYDLGDGEPPYLSLETSLTATEHGAGASRAMRIERGYDALGNVTSVHDHGDLAGVGDERLDLTAYVDLGGYIVGLPSLARTFSGSELLAQKRFTYDGTGNLTREEAWLDETGEWLAHDRAYDAHGNVIAETDALGAVTTIVWDPTFHLFEINRIDAVGHSIDKYWDARCSATPVLEIDPNGAITERDFDVFCRQTAEHRPVGWTLTSYLDFGTPDQRVRTETPGPFGEADLYEEQGFDGLGRVHRIERQDEAPVVETMSYDARGNLASRTAPRRPGEPERTTRYGWDALGRNVTVRHADASQRTRSYAPGVVTETDEDGHVTRTTRDARGEVIKRERGHDGHWVVESYQRDPLGRLVGIVGPTGASFGYGYDSLGRMLIEDDPDRGLRHYEYDAVGRLAARVDAIGQRTELSYDAIGRMIQKTTRAGTEEAATAQWFFDEPRGWGFANAGKLTTAMGPGGEVTTFDWDSGGRLVRQGRQLDGETYLITQGWDEGDRLVYRHFPDGDSLGPLDYDAAGRVEAIPGIVSAASYEGTGTLHSVSYANGTTSEYQHSAERGFLSSIRTSKGAQVLQELSYARDAEGRIMAVASPFAHEGWEYEYDDLHRLTVARSATSAWESQTFTWDDAGNLMSQTGMGCSEHGAPGDAQPHALLGAGDKSFAYDDNGNMVSWNGVAIELDGDERMVQLGEDSYAYDADGVRLRATQDGVTTLVGAGDYEVTDGVATKYFSLGQHLVAKRVGDETSWLHVDALGSIQVVTDETGAQVQRHAYRPFGDEIADLTDHEDARDWIGEHRDASGLMFLNARYYDPSIGRFLAPDPSPPLDPGVGLNRYAYAGGDPINQLDPSGLAAEEEKARDLGTVAVIGTRNFNPPFATFMGDWSYFGQRHAQTIAIDPQLVDHDSQTDIRIRDLTHAAELLERMAGERGGRFSAILLRAHGGDGSIEFGAGTNDVKAQSLSDPAVRAALQRIGAVLHPDGAIQFLSCSMCATTDGKKFADTVADITGRFVVGNEDWTWGDRIQAGYVAVPRARKEAFERKMSCHLSGRCGR